jgi:hypothetical protein
VIEAATVRAVMTGLVPVIHAVMEDAMARNV